MAIGNIGSNTYTSELAAKVKGTGTDKDVTASESATETSDVGVVYEPSKETTQTSETQTVTTVSALESTSEISENAETITNEQQTYTSEISETNQTDVQQNELINIITATAEELKQLNGIGDVIAARIVEYAQTVGFNSIEDIKNVKGIGDKKFENIKDKITV